MGTFNNYRGLKEFGEKVIKFKQKVSIEAAHAGKKISEEHFQIVKNGACASLVMLWMLQKFGDHSLFHRGQGVASVKDQENMDIAACATPRQVTYIGGWDPDDPDRCLSRLARNYSIAISSSFLVSRDLADLLAHLEKDKLYYVAYNLKEGRSGHAIGVGINWNKNRSSPFYEFFDPNVGEWRVPLAKFSAFFSRYLEILKDSLKWEPQRCWAYHALPKQLAPKHF